MAEAEVADGRTRLWWRRESGLGVAEVSASLFRRTLLRRLWLPMVESGGGGMAGDGAETARGFWCCLPSDRLRCSGCCWTWNSSEDMDMGEWLDLGSDSDVDEDMAAVEDDDEEAEARRPSMRSSQSSSSYRKALRRRLLLLRLWELLPLLLRMPNMVAVVAGAVATAVVWRELWWLMLSLSLPLLSLPSLPSLLLWLATAPEWR
mmetsp:Transcript_11916/g.34383  ORF Transcript_11916/g.34383 Transcript_11916/m.34383 type:complete len:205 (+) Transcript_11916:1143-1757(+)